MASQELKDIRSTKQDLEEEVSTLKKIQKTACNHDDVSELRRKLQDSEVRLEKLFFMLTLSMQIDFHTTRQF